MTELDDLRSAARDFLQDNAPVRSNLQDDPGVWKRLSTEMGLTALPVEDVPLSWVTTVVEETGRVLLRAPYLSTVVAAAALKDAGDGQHLAGLADGSVTAALALSGNLDQVPHAAAADLLLVAKGDELWVVEELSAEPLETLDLTRPAARVQVSAGRPVGTAWHARDLEHVALAAECVGASQRVLELVVEHLLVRTQFGRPLGSFQALRHKVADLTVLVEAARSTTWYAASEPEDFAVAAPLARALASEAFVTVTGEAIQLFGGIGFTWEHDAHLYFKRAWTTALAADSKALKRLAFERSKA
ncbi:MAG: acyl-CoA dehydrogenase [Frankiales bacterium]|nr:acyl-CoA dehydrogenase [Frankiales bacterium]